MAVAQAPQRGGVRKVSHAGRLAGLQLQLQPPHQRADAQLHLRPLPVLPTWRTRNRQRHDTTVNLVARHLCSR